MNFFGFPEYITNWINILYTGFTIQIQNSGFLSEKIDVTRSVHQGGCASAFLFIVLVETLAIALREDGDIKGVVICDEENKLNQFADDTSLWSPWDIQNMERIIKKLKWFTHQSGLTVNYEKTVLYRVGSLRNSNATLIMQEQMAWVDEGLNMLGVYITDDTQRLEKKNYDPILLKIDNILKSWKGRRLSLLGKVTVLNSLIASMLVHKMQALPRMSTEMISRINLKMTDFIWNGRRPKIPLRVLQLNKKDGGLNLVNIEARDLSLKAAWVQIVQSDQKCAHVAYQLISPCLGQDIFRCNLSESMVKHVMKRGASPFWYDVLIGWARYLEGAQHRRPVQGCFIWWNSEIKIEGKAICWKIPYQRGLKWVSQLYHSGKLISVREAYQLYALSFMDFYALVTAIPTERKEAAKAGFGTKHFRVRQATKY